VSCIRCGAKAVTERSDRTAQGYRRFRCRTCGKQFNERAGTLLNRAQYPSNVIALVVLWRLRYKLSLRELPEMFLIRGIVFSHEAVRDWEAKLTPALAEGLRRHRRGKVGRGWYVAETYIKVNGQWRYLYRAIDRSGALVDVMFSEHRDMGWPTLEQPPGSHFAIRPPAAGRTFDATRLQPRREPPLIPAVMTRFHRKLPPKSRRLWNPNPSE
jgi:putative transposase